ncbi:MAG: sel1 repeat family protein, partial [Parvibaculaceae bacterium]|nr:sel1 repeat family protein [Parvibaculaceae bacterium]
AGVAFLALIAFQSTSSADGAVETLEELDGTVIERPSEASGWVLYRRGLYDEALSEWQLAVETKSDAGAAFKIAEEYFDAKIVKRDIAKVVKYLTIGAEGGDARAQMDLATLYDNGWGVSKDVDAAGKWFLASAKQGMLEAQYNVATMYEMGQGVEKSLEKSYMFFLLAVEGGFQPFAQTGLEGVMTQMTPQQIKAGTVMAREFKANKNL